MITTIGGENFFLGNNPDTDGYYRKPEFVNAYPSSEREDYRRKASELSGRELSFQEASDFWFSQGLNFIKEKPSQFIRLTFRKLILFWNFYEAPDSYNYYFQKKFSSLLNGPVLHFGIIAPLGLLGLALSIGRARQLAVLYIIFFGYMAPFLLFYNFSRYRLPATPFVIIFASYTVWWLYDKTSKQQFKPVIAACAALIILFLACNYQIKGIDPYRSDFDGSYAKLGSAFVKTGQYDEAIKSFESAIRLNPENAQFHLNMGNTLFLKGDIGLAQKVYMTTIDLDASYAEAYNGLGNVFVAKQQLDLAGPLYQKAIELGPKKPEYYSNLGFVYYDQGFYKNAISQQHEALKIDPEFTNSYYGLALAFEASGQHEKAIFHWQKFMSLSKEDKWLEEARKRLKRLKEYNRK
jgi:tetratricopeptide (TPR) repeat protein